jgi:uncharacterized protein YdhG (YjbR/CyaY superfamily)
MRTTTRTAITTVDGYLARLAAPQRQALERVRRIIHRSLPGIEEGISYHLPVFRHEGRWLVWLGAARQHCALYGVVGLDRQELAAYDTSGRGTLRFTPDEPLPAALIRRIVKARAAQNAARKPAARRTRRAARTS